MKKICLLIAGCSLAVMAYAGILYINYNTGDFECSNGYKSNFQMCNKNSSEWRSPQHCLTLVRPVCQ